jgi:hypothetical protein
VGTYLFYRKTQIHLLPEEVHDIHEGFREMHEINLRRAAFDVPQRPASLFSACNFNFQEYMKVRGHGEIIVSQTAVTGETNTCVQ